MNKAPLLLTLTLLSLALAGCHAPDEAEHTGDDGMGDNGDGDQLPPLAITLTVQDAPDTVAVGQSFNVTVTMMANREATSSHLGAHYGMNSTANVSADQYRAAGYLTKASPHITTNTTIEGDYTITDWTFTAEEAGTIYFRAHVATSDGNHWSDEHQITVTTA